MPVSVFDRFQIVCSSLLVVLQTIFVDALVSEGNLLVE
jgi:hypothetical protein